MARLKVVRVIVMEGEEEWVNATLDLSCLKPGAPRKYQPDDRLRGWSIEEISRSVQLLAAFSEDEISKLANDLGRSFGKFQRVEPPAPEALTPEALTAQLVSALQAAKGVIGRLPYGGPSRVTYNKIVNALRSARENA